MVKDFIQRFVRRQKLDEGAHTLPIYLLCTSANLIKLAVLGLMSVGVFVFFSGTYYTIAPTGTLWFSIKPFIALLGLSLLCAVTLVIRLQISDRLRMIITTILLFLGPLGCVAGVEWINDSYLMSQSRPQRWLANYLCNLLLFVLVHALFRRPIVTASVGAGVCLLFGIATYYIVQFRGSPILPWDFKSLNTAVAVMDTYQLDITFRVLFVVMAYALYLLIISRLSPSAHYFRFRVKLIERAIAAALCVALVVTLLPMNVMRHMDINVWPWNQKASTKMTGVSAGFIGNLQFVMVEKPDGYSVENVNAIAEQIKETPAAPLLGAPKKRPTIIAIMNESFADITAPAQGKVTLSADTMPFVRKLMASDNIYSGTAYSSVYGGSTCDSEFEFLSSSSMAFLPIGSKPYQQYISQPMPALANALKNEGYDTLAIHPGRADAWHRNKVYPLLGFDRFIPAMEFTVPREKVRAYTSDRSCYSQLIKEYEAQKEKDNPLFIFNVTIQNHGGFDEPDYPATVKIAGTNKPMPDMEQYLTLVRESDEALKSLISYFEKQQEPVVLLFFGDHWPVVNEDLLSIMFGDQTDNQPTADETLQKHMVPFFVWANYPLDAKQNQVASLNQLSGLLLRSAGIQQSLYQDYVMRFSETIPVLTGNGWMDSSGKAYLRGDDHPYNDIMDEYAKLQYNLMFGKEERQEEIFQLRK